MKNKKIIAIKTGYAIAQFVLLPLFCGVLTALIIHFVDFEKLGDHFEIFNFPTITDSDGTWSNYGGLKLAAGLGCVLGMLLSRILKFGAKLGHFEFISPSLRTGPRSVPSTKTFFIGIFKFFAVPAIVILSAVTALFIAENEILPGLVDAKYQMFQKSAIDIVLVASIGCLAMYLYDMIFSTILRMLTRKD